MKYQFKSFFFFISNQMKTPGLITYINQHKTTIGELINYDLIN